MSDPVKCPAADDWQQHLDGELPAERDSELTAHLGACETCQKTVDTLASGGDSLMEFAGQLGPDALPAEPALREAMANVPNPFEASPSESKAAMDMNFSFLQPPTQPDHLGRLGHYAILELVGRGGFGLVFRAFDEKLRRVVAVKVLAPELAAHGVARRRFVREAQAVAAVRNEHIIGIYEVQESHQPPYLAMEFIEGQSLQQKIDRVGQLGTTAILRIGVQMAEGLAAAHKQGLIHRDIKPGNVLLENGVERVKITDFGLARAADDASTTQSGTIAGTPAYMSPEQAHGEVIDVRSDLFSLGSVLYAMAAGEAPFTASTAMATLLRVAEKDPKPLGKLNAEIPDWLVAIITKLHAKKRADRYESAREVADTLAKWLAHVQQPGATERPDVPMPAETPAANPLPSPSPTPASVPRAEIAPSSIPQRKSKPTTRRRAAFYTMFALFSIPLAGWGLWSAFLDSSFFSSKHHKMKAMDSRNIEPIRAEPQVVQAHLQDGDGKKTDVELKHDDRKTPEFPKVIDQPKLLEPALPPISLPKIDLPHVAPPPPPPMSLSDALNSASGLRATLFDDAPEKLGSATMTREIRNRYLRLRTGGLPGNIEMLQYIDLANGGGVSHSWLFDSYGYNIGLMKGTWNGSDQTLTLAGSGEPLKSSAKQTMKFSRVGIDCELSLNLAAPKLTSKLKWQLSDPDRPIFVRDGAFGRTIVARPEPLVEPLLPTSKEQELLFQLTGDSIVNVFNKGHQDTKDKGKEEPGAIESQRSIVRMKWAKVLGGLLMEGSFDDPIAETITGMLAYYDKPSRRYHVWFLPDKGDPILATGIFDDTGKILTLRSTASPDGRDTEWRWTFESNPERCDWLVKKNIDKAGDSWDESHWTSRGTIRPKPAIANPNRIEPIPIPPIPAFDGSPGPLPPPPLGIDLPKIEVKSPSGSDKPMPPTVEPPPGNAPNDKAIGVPQLEVLPPPIPVEPKIDGTKRTAHRQLTGSRSI